MNAVVSPTHGGTLAERLHGTEPKPLDVVMPKLIYDIYDYDGNGRLDGALDWRPLRDEELRAYGVDPALQVNKKNGLLSQVYTDDQGNFALVYAGSNEFKDWIPTNFGQGLGFETAQYSQAIRLAQEAQRAFGDNLVLSGQSLGGGLAASASMVTGVPALTYNAAGVHRRTVERFGVSFDEAREIAAAGNIRSYRVDGDILTQVQEKTPILRSMMPDAVGVQIDLPNPYPDVPVTIKQGVKLHLIHAVIDSMDQRYPEWRPQREDALQRDGDGLLFREPGKGGVEDRSGLGRLTPGGHPGKPLEEPPIRLLDDPSHRDHALYRQSYDGLRQWEEARGVVSGGHTVNLAGALAAESRHAGVRNIDQVLVSDDGSRAFAMEYDASKPDGRNLVMVETSQGVHTSLLQSSQRAEAEYQQALSASTAQAEQQAHQQQTMPRGL
ncbi:hypothetical protein EBB59_02205 [Lysobacter pythonis]|uniref:X-Tfes XVIPCD domain-containing protein n=1 Tax=Solilutibacter pythonis TaxID=2483112 RepID=A0A3M2I7P3_9GAMM|nr:XVIPCD domain-containing protein [Lysobacter pythonis]RMH94507.1 hypothetical protein EBB59_02205 [Lysobacter pythonis]